MASRKPKKRKVSKRPPSKRPPSVKKRSAAAKRGWKTRRKRELADRSAQEHEAFYNRSQASTRGWQKRRQRKKLIDAIQGLGEEVDLDYLPKDELREWLQWIADRLGIPLSEAYRLYYSQWTKS